jgi:hypothetical protein
MNRLPYILSAGVESARVVSGRLPCRGQCADARAPCEKRDCQHDLYSEKVRGIGHVRKRALGRFTRNSCMALSRAFLPSRQIPPRAGLPNILIRRFSRQLHRSRNGRWRQSMRFAMPGRGGDLARGMRVRMQAELGMPWIALTPRTEIRPGPARWGSAASEYPQRRGAASSSTHVLRVYFSIYTNFDLRKKQSKGSNSTNRGRTIITLV